MQSMETSSRPASKQSTTTDDSIDSDLESYVDEDDEVTIGSHPKCSSQPKPPKERRTPPSGRPAGYASLANGTIESVAYKNGSPVARMTAEFQSWISSDGTAWDRRECARMLVECVSAALANIPEVFDFAATTQDGSRADIEMELAVSEEHEGMRGQLVQETITNQLLRSLKAPEPKSSEDPGVDVVSFLSSLEPCPPPVLQLVSGVPTGEAPSSQPLVNAGPWVEPTLGNAIMPAFMRDPRLVTAEQCMAFDNHYYDIQESARLPAWIRHPDSGPGRELPLCPPSPKLATSVALDLEMATCMDNLRLDDGKHVSDAPLFQPVPVPTCEPIPGPTWLPASKPTQAYGQSATQIHPPSPRTSFRATWRAYCDLNPTETPDPENPGQPPKFVFGSSRRGNSRVDLRSTPSQPPVARVVFGGLAVETTIQQQERYRFTFSSAVPPTMPQFWGGSIKLVPHREADEFCSCTGDSGDSAASPPSIFVEGGSEPPIPRSGVLDLAPEFAYQQTSRAPSGTNGPHPVPPGPQGPSAVKETESESPIPLVTRSTLSCSVTSQASLTFPPPMPSISAQGLRLGAGTQHLSTKRGRMDDAVHQMRPAKRTCIRDEEV
ncbi:hypothetical protein BROUX41_003286 [Berkeleyomyces rouxiae]